MARLINAIYSGGVSVGGVEYKTGADGVLDVPDDVAKEVLSSGFHYMTPEEEAARMPKSTPAPTPAPVVGPSALASERAQDMPRSDLMQYCRDNGIEIATGTKVGEVRRLVADHIDAQAQAHEACVVASDEDNEVLETEPAPTPEPSATPEPTNEAG